MTRLQRALCALVLLILGREASATPIEQVMVFPFNSPFKYYEHPAADQASGFSDLIFPSRGFCLVAGTFEQQYFLFDSTWKQIYATPPGFGYVFHAESSRYLLIGKGKFSDPKVLVWIYDRQDPLRLLYTLEAGGYGGDFFYVSGNVVFFGSDQGLVVWELLGNGRNRFYDPTATSDWLAAGNAVRFGYLRDVRTHFGTNVMGSSMEEPRIQQTDFSIGKQLGFIPGKTEMYEVGRDAKGLIYFYSIGPGDMVRPTSTSGFYYFGIIDPWTKKATFRFLGDGHGVSPNGNAGLPKAVAPDGSIYFFDTDMPRKQFVLRRLVNDWWKELGIAERTVGVVNDNRVRLRDKGSLQGQPTGYVYENEFALVIETTAYRETIDGSTSPWYQVQMEDGRRGWMFGSFLNLQN